MRILITGGLGFIGSSVIRNLFTKGFQKIINLDNETYAANKNSLSAIKKNPNYVFLKGDIADKKFIEETFYKFKPHFVMNLAAETHVDRSITNPAQFIHTNINGTFNLLEISRKYLSECPQEIKRVFRFHQISTDEVFGSLGRRPLEDSRYKPNFLFCFKSLFRSFSRAWHHTFNMPTIITNCSNNYGPYQYIEKLIPLTIFNALKGKPIPVYGNGLQIRDWLYVDDHAEALYLILSKGKIGETYNIGGNNEISNIELVKKICKILNRKIKIKPENIKSFINLIQYVPDRPGHDFRYGIDASKLRDELGWEPKTKLDEGLEKTIDWYIDNQ